MFGSKTHYDVRIECKNCNHVNGFKVEKGITLWRFSRTAVCEKCGIEGEWR